MAYDDEDMINWSLNLERGLFIGSFLFPRYAMLYCAMPPYSVPQVAIPFPVPRYPDLLAISVQFIFVDLDVSDPSIL